MLSRELAQQISLTSGVVGKRFGAVASKGLEHVSFVVERLDRRPEGFVELGEFDYPIVTDSMSDVALEPVAVALDRARTQWASHENAATYLGPETVITHAHLLESSTSSPG